MTKEQIKDALEKDYNRDNWVSLIRNVFNNGSFNAKPVEISITKNDIAENAFEIGSFETVDERIIGIYEIKIKKDINLERNRVGLRQLLRSVYKQVDGAFVVFNQDKRWRFSYVSEISSRNENGKLIKSQTEPKRFTYLFGEGINNRTAIDRFFKLTGKPVLLEGIKETFSVDALTKEFYKELSDWYFWALQHVEFPNDEEKDKDVRNSTSTMRLITRIMFVWFLKQKGLIPDELFNKEEVDKIIKYNDKKESTYYKAVLQNLFFATLNTEMGDSNRKFVDRQYGIQGYYRYKRFFKDVDRFLEITKNVPFLNGGLFENLDKNVGTKEEKRIDCFSNRLENENRISVPDYLFFGNDTVDLSVVYDDKKRNKVEVHGLIDILKKYNFTIEENTPLEVEVALDPELLGKVFENLLASYNPETKSTARKQTGSFYTPREVVDYMVDESLKAYLLQNLLNITSGYVELGKKQTELLGNEAKKGQLSIKQEIKRNDSQKERYEKLLSSLLSYSDDTHNFNEKEIDVLISAIDNCKILDPACGSGAFPMGILHKMVHVLHKLDPKNKLWKEKQITRVKNAREAISQIQDLTARENNLKELEKTQEDIEKSFANNELDYGRKLYLIENCIYGVDIQPIAVQIAKLRFFISLVVDQNIHDKEDNLGIRPLPNLETKFVAANTLISLDKESNNLFTNPEIEKKKAELKRVRLDHFEAKTPGRKTRLRKQDEELRALIADLLVVEHELQPKAAKLLANWNPYNQNSSASFFDPEWMFGLNNGFDVVIGNPPYVFTRDVDFSSDFKDYVANKYFTSNEKGKKTKSNQSGKINLFSIFILCGMNLTAKNGTLCYIIPNNILRTTTYDSTRKLILEKSYIEEIVDLGSGVFDSVTASTIILRLKNTKEEIGNTKIRLNITNIENRGFKSIEIPQNQFQKNVSYAFNIFIDKKKADLIQKIESNSAPLGNFCIDIIEGIVAHKHLIQPDSSKNSVPLLEGKDIKRYFIGGAKNHLLWDRSQIHRTRPDYLWEADKKIVMQRISGGVKPLVAALDEDKIKTFASINNILLKVEFNNYYKYFTAVLNSNILNWYYANNFSNNSTLTVNISKTYLEKLPIIIPNETVLKIIDVFVKIVSKLKNLENISPQVTLMISYFEKIIDGVIYELYFPNELKSNNSSIIISLSQIDLKLNIKSENSIENLFLKLYEPSNPVRVAVFKMDIVEEVAVIEGKNK